MAELLKGLENSDVNKQRAFKKTALKNPADMAWCTDATHLDHLHNDSYVTIVHCMNHISARPVIEILCTV